MSAATPASAAVCATLQPFATCDRRDGQQAAANCPPPDCRSRRASLARSRRWPPRCRPSSAPVLRARTTRCSTRSSRNGVIASSRLRRVSVIGTERSARVSRQLPDQRDGAGTEGRERARLVIVADIAQHRTALAMPAVQDAAQLFVLPEKAVGLVDHQASDDSPRRRGRSRSPQTRWRQATAAAPAARHVERVVLPQPLRRRA